jgi:two-component system, chemotaxis family, CheB/CheR fusion protein
MAANVEHVLAIGSSAGGLEALQALLGPLREGGSVACLVAQHLAPDHPSQLVDLLSRATPLRVEQAVDGASLEPGLILVLPPNCDAELDGDRLLLNEPRGSFGPSPSIDHLFDSLARHWGERAVAVVLSGTGSDGARGLRSVGARGGLALVQSPESARFTGMPLAAIAMGGADLIADPATLGSRLQEWFSSGEGWRAPGGIDPEALVLTSAIAQLKRRTGIDFSLYKESTLRRQIQRRLAVLGLKNIEDYLPVLSADASECQALMQNLLVTVTSFFRDADAFVALSTHLKSLLESRPTGEQIRVWIPGCATGEEAYSIGMIVSEMMGHPPHLCQELKIFATDLDEQSLRIARRGVYPASAVRDMPESLRQRFVQVVGNEIEITKELRGCIVFARHNIGQDPPFPGIDLISCRNLLIYFTAALQEQVIDLLALSLRPGGLLFLGSSESLSPAAGFRLLNPVHRIYERSAEPRSRRRLARAMPMQRVIAPQRPSAHSSQATVPVSAQHIQLLEALVRNLIKPSLVVDENHHLLEVIGDVSPYCRIPDGRITAEVSIFLCDELQAEARALFLLVRADRMPVRSCSLHLPHLGSPVWLEAVPLQVGDQALTLLSFNLVPIDSAAPMAELTAGDRDGAFSQEIERLERELLASQDTLRRSILDLEQANQELEASSEELQASSEELQSSNEELEASNEELQAANDELAALNEQLRAHSNELERLNTDMENIQLSLNQGMVIVDNQLRITRFSPLAVRVFGLVQSDLGQSLIGLPTTVPIPRLRESLLDVIRGAPRISLEASSEDTSYLVQLMPYRNGAGTILGGIITLTDVSEMLALRRVAEASLQEFTSLADALDQVVWKRDHTLNRFLYLSRRIETLTGWKVAELCADTQLFENAIHPDDKDRVDAARRASQAGWTVTYRLNCPSRGQRSFCEVARILDETNHHYVVGTLADVTDAALTSR